MELSNLKNLFIASLTLFVLLFSACSTKKVFEPQNVAGDWEKEGTFDEEIIDSSSNIALLENRTVLAKDKVIGVEIPESFRALSKSDGWVISSSIDGHVLLQYIDDKSLNKELDLKKTVAGATIKDDLLAVLFADNEMALYSVSTNELLLKEQGGTALAVDSRIVNPHFLDDLVLFPTLDGKVVIVNTKLKKRLRTAIVSSEEQFNNIIYFNVIDNKVIAATGHKLLSLAQKEIREKYDIRTATYDNENIFITTKEGEVVSLTPELLVNSKVKFPFAHFLGMIATKDKIYLLEKEGYLIELEKDLSQYTIYDVDIDDGYVFVADKMFFVDDKYISVE